jgi:DNA polymerase-4
MNRLVMHVDLGAFHAAIEQRDHPEWRRLPVVAGAEPGKRGVVATCSYEARRYGVPSAMPISEARRLPPETLSVRPCMEDYARVSRQVMEVLETISPVEEKVSINEAYLDVSGLERPVGPPGHRLRAGSLPGHLVWDRAARPFLRAWLHRCQHHLQPASGRRGRRPEPRL